MSDDKKAIELKGRVVAYEVMFQSLFSALPDDVKSKAIANVVTNFKGFDSGTQSETGAAVLAVAKIIASRTTGAKL
ncbi:hypothetical protein EGH44_00445 [Klebsiella aerogenes]|nr:hypothetical protein EGH44_00445 [Klebsiella aerogenes]